MTESKSFVFRFGDMELREREFCLVKAGEVSPIEPKAFRVLLFLLHNPQKLITKEELLDAVWADAAVTESSLTRSIAKLRRVLGDDIREPRYIATVATVGYRFIGKVEVSEEPSGVPENTKEPPPALNGAGKKVRSRKQLWGWALAGGGVLALCLAGAAWFLHRPLPPPRITQYTQITHDGHQKTLVGTDGTRLYFNQMSGSATHRIDRSGRNIGRSDCTGPGCATQPDLVDVSPDGSSFLVAADAGLWNVRILGGQARHLGDPCCRVLFTGRELRGLCPIRRGHLRCGERWDGNPQTDPCCWRHRQQRRLVSGQRHRLVSGRRRDPVYHEGPDLGDVFERIGASRGDARLARLLRCMLRQVDS